MVTSSALEHEVTADERREAEQMIEVMRSGVPISDATRSAVANMMQKLLTAYIEQEGMADARDELIRVMRVGG